MPSWEMGTLTGLSRSARSPLHLAGERLTSMHSSSSSKRRSGGATTGGEALELELEQGQGLVTVTVQVLVTTTRLTQRSSGKECSGTYATSMVLNSGDKDVPDFGDLSARKPHFP